MLFWVQFSFFGTQNFWLANVKSKRSWVLYYAILSSSYSSHYIASKSDPKNENGAQKHACFYFFRSIFWKSNFTGHRAPFKHINWQEMGKSSDEQPFLAAYKLRLASANSKTTPYWDSLPLKNIRQHWLYHPPKNILWLWQRPPSTSSCTVIYSGVIGNYSGT